MVVCPCKFHYLGGTKNEENRLRDWKAVLSAKNVLYQFGSVDKPTQKLQVLIYIITQLDILCDY